MSKEKQTQQYVLVSNKISLEPAAPVVDTDAPAAILRVEEPAGSEEPTAPVVVEEVLPAPKTPATGTVKKVDNA